MFVSVMVVFGVSRKKWRLLFLNKYMRIQQKSRCFSAALKASATYRPQRYIGSPVGFNPFLFVFGSFKKNRVISNRSWIRGKKFGFLDVFLVPSVSREVP